MQIFDWYVQILFVEVNIYVEYDLILLEFLRFASFIFLYFSV